LTVFCTLKVIHISAQPFNHHVDLEWFSYS